MDWLAFRDYTADALYTTSLKSENVFSGLCRRHFVLKRIGGGDMECVLGRSIASGQTASSSGGTAYTFASKDSESPGQALPACPAIPVSTNDKSNADSGDSNVLLDAFSKSKVMASSCVFNVPPITDTLPMTSTIVPERAEAADG